jgi:hypothetical protein
MLNVGTQPSLRRCRIKQAVTVEVSVGGGWKAAALPRMAALRIAVYEGWAKIEGKSQIRVARKIIALVCPSGLAA